MFFSPLPNLKDFFSPLKKRIHNEKEILKPWIKEGEKAGWLSRSAWSFVLIALWKRNQVVENRKINIWIPDYFCNSSIELLRKTEQNIFFYRIKKDMEPDYSDCREMALKNPPDIFLFVHYFGKPLDSANAKQFCANYNSWLIEDAVHVLVPKGTIGKHGDFVLYSPHKIFPIPNGAILVVRKKGPGSIDIENKNFINKDKWIGILENFILSKKIKIKFNKKEVLKWYFKKIFQKLGFNRKVFLKFTDLINTKSSTNNLFDSPNVSNLSLIILKNHIKKIFLVALSRKKNNKIWNYFILNNFSTKIETSLFNNHVRNNDHNPYLSAFRFKNGLTKDIFYQLQTRNIKVSTWPDLPPEIHKQKEFHKNAWELRNSYLYLPCHQSISPNSFYKIFKKDSLTQFESNKIHIEKNKIRRSDWDELIEKTNKSNLLQSWSYGNAKKSDEGWQLDRLVFKKQNNPLAFVSVLKKKILFFKIIRINRGPLFLPYATDSDREIILKKIFKMGSFLKMSLLSIAPEISLNGKNISFLISNNFKFYKTKTWSSVNLNLDSNIEEIKSNFTSKWRNKLAVSQKNNLNIEFGSNSQLMSWMLKKYKLSMKENSFKGISVPIFKRIYNEMNDNSSLIFFRVTEDGIPVSGLCIACHGQSSTYLIGWTGKRGRDVKANHFQLWNVICELKKIGIKSIDLGGIDEDLTPGITEFKLGIGGDQYSLVGEGWKWN
ncbi:MAG: glycosyltransferase [Flavobacteriaceae bacterium]|nr:glycosyltransferase [Flavobacteriaceae bacterium]|tara:strand:+ start:1982 stop:4135 length:2154 start_codon:yes stop_codon:yes gene_type:complete